MSLKFRTGVLVPLFAVACAEERPSDDESVGETRQPITNGVIVSTSDADYTAVNRAAVGLDAGDEGSRGSGVLIAPRLVLTASHCGKNGICGATGTTVEIGVDSITPLEQIGVTREHDWPNSCSRQGASKGGCTCDPDRYTNHDLGIWVLDRPARHALPYFETETEIPIGSTMTFFGFGANGAPQEGLLAKGDCTVQLLQNGMENGPRALSTCGTQGSFDGDSGGPVFNAQHELIGVNIGSGAGYDSIAMRFTEENLAWIDSYRQRYRTTLRVLDVDGDHDGDFFHWNWNNEKSFLDVNGGTIPDGAADKIFTFCKAELVLGDFDNDGHTDLLCADPSTGGSSILYAGQRDLFGGTPVSLPMFCAATLLVGDFDGDGWDDFFCRNDKDDAPTRRLRLNTKSAAAPLPTTDTWSEPFKWCAQELYVGHFDNDARADLLCRNPGEGYAIRFAEPDGHPGDTVDVATGWCGQKLLVGDVGGDERDDLVCLDQNYDRVWVDLAEGAGYPFDGTNWRDLDYAFCGQQASLADVDGDLKADLVCHDWQSGVTWFDHATTDWTGEFVGFDDSFDAKSPAVDTPLWP
jgi:V8-like Glu-specific endopeptidase